MVTVGSRSIGVVAVVAVLAIAPLSAAQEASFSVTLEPQDEAGTLSPGDSSDVTVLVQLEGDGFSCTGDEELPVQLSAQGASGVTGSPATEEIVFSNTMGIHSSDGPSGPYNESDETTVTVEASNGASSGTHDVTVTGSFPGGNYAPPEGSCSGEFPPAEGTTSIPVTVEADEPDDGTTPGGDGGDGGSGGDTNGTDGGAPDGGEEDNGIPIGSWIAPIALVASAVALRRR